MKLETPAVEAHGPNAEGADVTVEDQQRVEFLASQAANALDREELIAELTQAKRHAEEASRSRAAFIANISHELRTPMDVVLGMTQLALETDLDPDQTEMLRTIALSAEALLGLVNDILDCSKIEAGRLELDTAPFEFRETLDNSIRGLAEQARQKNLRIRSVVDSTIPSWVSGDSGRLRQVIVNLVNNAIKFTSAGEITLQATRLDAQPRKTAPPKTTPQIDDETLELHFAVTDTGCGIPAAAQDQIFDAFAQVDESSTQNHTGTGLGLSICKSLVTLMGGKIWVDSIPDAGSTFHFTTHLSRAPESTAAGALDQPRIASSAGSTIPFRQPMHILVAEDSPLSQKLMRRILAQQHHSVVMTNDGREALEIFQRDTFDLILMDVQLPKLDGLETTRQIRLLESSTGRRTPIIALTANAFEADQERCLQAGMDAYLAKPVDKQTLLALIQKMGAKGRLSNRSGAGSVKQGQHQEPRLTIDRPNRVQSLNSSLVFDSAQTLARCDNDLGFTLEIVDLFLESTSVLKADLFDAAASADSDTVRRLAHRLAGAATNVSGYRVEETARLLMRTADGELGEVILHLTRLDSELADLEQALVDFRLDLVEGSARCVS